MSMHSLELNWLEPKMLRTCSTFFLFVSFSLCSSPSPPALPHAQNTSVTPLLRSNGTQLLRSNGFWSFPFLHPLPSPTLRIPQFLHCCEAMVLHCCEAMVFFFLPALHPLPSPTLRILYSIAAKQWYSLVLLT